MFNTVSIIGCGLIGSSVLRAIQNKNLAKEVRIFDLSKESTAYLKKKKYMLKYFNRYKAMC
jgi:cyclohexadieny/prephenate dehydrogenase